MAGASGQRGDRARDCGDAGRRPLRHRGYGSRVTRAAVLLALVALASGGGDGHGAPGGAQPEVTTSPAPAVTATTSSAATTTTVKATTTTRAPSTSSPGAPIVQVAALRGVGSGQAIVVHAGGYGQT